MPKKYIGAEQKTLGDGNRTIIATMLNIFGARKKTTTNTIGAGKKTLVPEQKPGPERWHPHLSGCSDVLNDAPHLSSCSAVLKDDRSNISTKTRKPSAMLHVYICDRDPVTHKIGILCHYMAMAVQ